VPEMLPQQRLLLELIVYSGDIGIPDLEAETIFYRTMKECQTSGWIKVAHFGAGVNKLSITEMGRLAVKIR